MSLFKKKNKKGFTLIELLVVIAVISLLSSVVLSSLNSAREKAKISRAKVEVKQIVRAIIIAQGEQGKPLITFAPNSNCLQCFCADADITSSTCLLRWTNALTEIQNATNGLVSGLINMTKDPWGNPYQIDANQYESYLVSRCSFIDRIWVYGKTIPELQTIPLSPICP